MTGQPTRKKIKLNPIGTYHKFIVKNETMNTVPKLFFFFGDSGIGD